MGPPHTGHRDDRENPMSAVSCLIARRAFLAENSLPTAMAASGSGSDTADGLAGVYSAPASSATPGGLPQIPFPRGEGMQHTDHPAMSMDEPGPRLCTSGHT